MFSVTHFRTEFIRQSQATIIRKVTMTQFMLMMICAAAGVGLLGAPFWLTPVFIGAGYTAGYAYNGEVVWKRVAAYLQVRGRTLAGAPQIVNIQKEWDSAQTRAERQQIVDRPLLGMIQE